MGQAQTVTIKQKNLPPRRAVRLNPTTRQESTPAKRNNDQYSDSEESGDESDSSSANLLEIQADRNLSMSIGAKTVKILLYGRECCSAHNSFVVLCF